MKISKRQLIEMNACKGGLKRFISQTNNTSELVDVASLVGGKNTYHDFLWLAEKTISKERIVRFAYDCALLNIELIRPCTDDYDLIVNFLNNPINSHNANFVSNYAEDASSDVARAASYAAESVNAAAKAAYDAYAVANAAHYASRIDYTSKKLVDKLLITVFNELQ